MPPEQPTLDTPRLRLRPFTPEDAPRLRQICADREVAATTLTLPHPYLLSDAEEYIRKQGAQFADGCAVALAVTMQDVGLLVGSISLHIDAQRKSAELGYLIGRRYWNRGYCTEAARALVAYGFAELGLRRIQANHFARNAASGRVMQKVGMKQEGTLRQHFQRWGEAEDAVVYGILKAEAQDLVCVTC